MKKNLTLRQKYMIEKGIFGLLWVGIGILELMKLKETCGMILAIVVFIYFLIRFISYFVKTEKEDEMSIYKYNRAKLAIYDILVFGILTCMSLSIPKDKWMIDLKLVLPFVVGGINFLEFILFVFYEKVGDKCCINK
ncbi:hypothetical protein IRP63_04575 [Clostridium botulinum]|uniref:Uncharacterized protein n=1 Tax=Clostridium botulinum C/D str. DC5 TaxID=1443128 RepID=A0A0A0IH63_CLOBO|nr:hypothetical protein [Clostridium botulinum]KEI00857.1 hypothetical protein Z952_13875 [Clostridium botulinum C/D str. BKT75002]KEI09171.1 hypothetical protein Z954_13615 [Clostridium botulinum C/D str. BKT2873]KGM96200.1 hypothetical protein Z956_03295 [Clostridium botulinum D str. CCUG 7971]KGN00775.1 hypothetical protein Z955_02525 [Clostridium botulinum C/D str. DC5]KOC46011.1 hypothetical protein ADU88_12720 [Clostridium botulinum]